MAGKSKQASKSKQDSKPINLNEDLSKHLAELGNKERIAGNTHFFAYMKASKALAIHDKRITSGKEALKLKGIGPKMVALIDQFLSGENETDDDDDDGSDSKSASSSSEDESSSGKRSKSKASGKSKATGKSKARDDDDEEEAGPSKKKAKKSSGSSIDSMRILDHYELLHMDKKTALNLVQVKEITTIGELRKNTSLITGSQAACLEHIGDLLVPVAGKEEVEAVKKELKKLIKEKLGDNFRLTVCGAYRRGAKLDSSLSVLVVNQELKSTSEKAAEELATSREKLLTALKEDVLLKADLDEEDSEFTDRFEALIQLPNSKVRRLSLCIAAADTAIGRLFTMTGSRSFVESTIVQAMERRFQLDEDGLRRLGETLVPGQLIPLKDEEELFEFLELPYVKPEKRN